ncbi:hypothetical protein CTKA_02373 [Chthonomonas calidirosea]|uniref:Uncharacterized protein n=2 Tax=Chthonomonas TaxID=1077265 RepID=S0EZ73_CHTCT|nr:hypothetical protein CCALI_01722 [Chthonomonas calidirosea T49]CEK19985.1 hypothetical protein CTKA_02373 [Chthonomonas calidirosea]
MRGTLPLKNTVKLSMRRSPITWLLLTVGLLAALIAVHRRFHVEMANRRVALGVEYAEVDQLARFANVPLASVLQDFKRQGLSALILTEDTPMLLETTGAIRPIYEPLPDGHSYTLAVVRSEDLLTRIGAALRARGITVNDYPSPESFPEPHAGITRFIVDPQVARHSVALEANLDYAHLRTLGIGLPPLGVAAAKQAGLQIVARIANFPGVSTATAAAVLQSLVAQGASVVIFNGDEVLGYRGQEKAIAPLLRPAHGIVYGDIEFGKQKGVADLTQALKGDYVRVHSILPAEMGQMTDSAMVERFGLAVRERNIRLCYIHLLTDAGSNAVAQNALYIKRIARRIEHGGVWTGGGFVFGPAHPFQRLELPVGLFALMGLAVGAGVAWMLALIVPLSKRQDLALTVGLAVVFGLLALVHVKGRQLTALAAGIAFPAIACLTFLPNLEPATSIYSNRDSLRRAIRTLLQASLLTLPGILLVVGLLASRIFLTKTDQFLGIKAQHAIPILLIALVLLQGGKARIGESWSVWKERALTGLRRNLNEPARYSILLLSIVALAVLAIMLVRTGNDAAVGVSPLELKFRALLDHLLPVRPRTKEFLIGHPAFVLAFAWWWRGRRRLALPTFVVGSIGQVSLLNTFCHIHTPLIVSAWRGGLGILLGGLIGAAIFLVVEALFPLKPSELVKRSETVTSDGRPAEPTKASLPVS